MARVPLGPRRRERIDSREPRPEFLQDLGRGFPFARICRDGGRERVFSYPHRKNGRARCAQVRPRSRRVALDVEPQHVVLGQTQSADGGAGFEATMRAVPVIAMQPDWEFGGTLIGIQIRAGIRPLA